MGIYRNIAGFAPVIVLTILAAIGITGVGSVAVANNSKPGDALFGFDKAIEEIRVTFTPGDLAKAKIRLEVTEERLQELQELEDGNQSVDPAIVETQQALNNVTSAVSNVEVKFKENQIRLESKDLQALLTELQSLLTAHQGLIRRVEIKIENDEIRAKIKFLKEEVDEDLELIEDDLDDLEDDGELNASVADTLEVELKGLLAKTGGVFQITHGGKTYTLTPAAGIDLDSFVGKFVELKGFGSNETPTNLTVVKVELEDEIEDDEEELEVEGLPEVEAKGFVRKSGSGFILTFNGGPTLYSLVSTKVNLSLFVDKFVKVEGTLSGNTLTVHEADVRKTSSSGEPVAPALQDTEDDDGDTDDNSDSGSSGSNSGSGSSGSGGSEGNSGSGSSGSGGGDDGD